MFIPAQIREAILAHAAFCAPEECCGLLAGDPDGRVRFAYPLTNALHSPVRFTIEPAEHFGALNHAERQGWELVGAFHSHPSGPAHPSSTDVAEAGEPDWVYLVATLTPAGLRAFRIRDGEVEVVALDSR